MGDISMISPLIDAIAFAEDAGLGHPVILRSREPSSLRRHLDRHRAPPASLRSSPIAQHITETDTPRKVPRKIR
jgi:hypothetical protein